MVASIAGGIEPSYEFPPVDIYIAINSAASMAETGLNSEPQNL
jgi:hypothetical protein